MPSYTALELVQQPNAPPMYLMTASAEELLDWCDVPKKTKGFMAGYQRELNERHKELKQFIEQSPNNIVPGAVILTADKGAVTVTPTNTQGVFTLEVNYIPVPPDERVAALADGFLARLNAEELAYANALVERVKSAPPETNPVEPVAAEVDADTSDEDIPPPSYLAQLAAELILYRDSRDRLSVERRGAIREYVEGRSKPGLILDGQHRVHGAKNVSKFDVYLPVVLVPGLPPGEQVFQFYVLNNKAVPLKPTELRSTVSTSLSNQEIEGLYHRFRDAGVHAEKSRLTHRLNTDADSPFRNLLDFGLGSEGVFIPENVMYQVVSRFVDPPKRYKTLYDKVQAWIADPHYDYRLGLFKKFWKTISEHYPDAWKTGGPSKTGQLFYKAAMLVLQELAFTRLAQNQPDRAMREEASRSRMRTICRRASGPHFTTYQSNSSSRNGHERTSTHPTDGSFSLLKCRRPSTSWVRASATSNCFGRASSEHSVRRRIGVISPLDMPCSWCANRTGTVVGIGCPVRR